MSIIEPLTFPWHVCSECSSNSFWTHNNAQNYSLSCLFLNLLGSLRAEFSGDIGRPGRSPPWSPGPCTGWAGQWEPVEWMDGRFSLQAVGRYERSQHASLRTLYILTQHHLGILLPTAFYYTHIHCVCVCVSSPDPTEVFPPDDTFPDDFFPIDTKPETSTTKTDRKSFQMIITTLHLGCLYSLYVFDCSTKYRIFPPAM